LSKNASGADRTGSADAAQRHCGNTAARLEETKKVSAALIDSYNALLPQLAKEARALFIPLPGMPVRHTFDGIHLNAAGYEVWDKAMLQGIEAALCKST